jgi:hypothetical protein
MRSVARLRSRRAIIAAPPVLVSGAVGQSARTSALRPRPAGSAPLGGPTPHRVDGMTPAARRSRGGAMTSSARLAHPVGVRYAAEARRIRHRIEARRRRAEARRSDRCRRLRKRVARALRAGPPPSDVLSTASRALRRLLSSRLPLPWPSIHASLGPTHAPASASGHSSASAKTRTSTCPSNNNDSKTDARTTPQTHHSTRIGNV